MESIVPPGTDEQDGGAAPGPCFKCGKSPADGFASIWTAATGERWYCHGDEDEFSCYEGANLVEPDAFGFAEYLLRPGSDA